MTNKTSIEWTPIKHLEDLDFADDISLLSHQHQHMQSKLTRLTEEAVKTGLSINETKTENKQINNKQESIIHLQGESIKETDHFTYLGSIV